MGRADARPMGMKEEREEEGEGKWERKKGHNWLKTIRVELKLCRQDRLVDAVVLTKFGRD